MGESESVGFDPGEGCVVAPFVPGKHYEKIGPTVRAFSMLGFSAETDANKAHAEEVLQRCAALGLTARTAAGERLEPSGGITLYDYSEELDEDPYEVALFGLPWDISEKYFHEDIRQYYGEDAAGGEQQ